MIGGHFPRPFETYRTSFYNKPINLRRLEYMNTRDWRVSNLLDAIELMVNNDPSITLEKLHRFAKLNGLRDDELWKIDHLFEALKNVDRS